MPRKSIGRRQRSLIGEQVKKNARPVGVGRSLREFQALAAFLRHRFCRVAQLHCRAPPPRRGRRSRLPGDRAPLPELAQRALELYIRSLMHQPSKRICFESGRSGLRFAETDGFCRSYFSSAAVAVAGPSPMINKTASSSLAPSQSTCLPKWVTKLPAGIGVVFAGSNFVPEPTHQVPCSTTM